MVQGGYVSQSKGQLTVNKKPNVLNKARIAGQGPAPTPAAAPSATAPVTNNGNGNATADNTANNNQQPIVSGITVSTNKIFQIILRVRTLTTKIPGKGNKSNLRRNPEVKSRDR